MYLYISSATCIFSAALLVLLWNIDENVQGKVRNLRDLGSFTNKLSEEQKIEYKVLEMMGKYTRPGKFISSIFFVICWIFGEPNSDILFYLGCAAFISLMVLMFRK